ncbi:MAG: Sau3AI family type II restriction endonuclease [bacterium]
MHPKTDGRYLKENEIITIGKSILHKTFGQIAESSETLLNKGSFGTFIEKEVYHLKPNSRSEPDFVEAGIELKVTPFKLNQDESYSAKERLVLNIINYVEEAKKTFYTSSFWTKNKKLYLLFYLWESNKAQKDFLIMFDYLLTFSDEDLIIIKRDWYIIHEKIVNGKAHEISEADTMYLAACTKGVNKGSHRHQYESDILAKQRAYSLKTSYMTQLLRTRVTDKKEDIVRLISDALELEKKSFEQIIYDRMRPYFGKSTKELIKQFKIQASKNINEIIVARLLGVQGRVSQTEEFLKANIAPKTIRLEEDGRMIESMSFPTFRYEEIAETDWEDSWHKDYFESTKFMFVIFKKEKYDYELYDIKFWNMPISVLENEFKEVWLHTQNIIRSGEIVREIKNGIFLTNFIKKSGHPLMHVRPHAQRRKDTYPLPVMDKKTGLTEYTKHCFWLNNNYVLEIIGNRKMV